MRTWLNTILKKPYSIFNQISVTPCSFNNYFQIIKVRKRQNELQNKADPQTRRCSFPQLVHKNWYSRYQIVPNWPYGNRVISGFAILENNIQTPTQISVYINIPIQILWNASDSIDITHGCLCLVDPKFYVLSEHV